MYFINRQDAAKQLLPLLSKYKGQQGIVMAIPRGGVPIGYYIAKDLNFQMDLLMTKKIGHPANEEFAIGAVSMEDSIVDVHYNIPQQYIEREINRIRKSLVERYKKFMGAKLPADIKNKIVIVVDDGAATGKTIFSTLKLLRSRQPKKLIVSVPVASYQAAKLIWKDADEFITLHIPDQFNGVGKFYKDFSEVTDKEVMSFLEKFHDHETVA